MAYPSSKPPRIIIQHQGTVSSNGKVTTTGANTAINFTNMVNSLEVTAHTGDITIKLKVGGVTETNSHLIEEGSSKIFDEMYLTGFIVVENGVVYSYSGAYY